MVRNPYTALIAVSLVLMQTAIAYGMRTLGFGYWWLRLLMAYCAGAFANHANYVIIHDAMHNLIFRSKNWNKMVAIIADLPNLTRGAMGFRVYHLKHHSIRATPIWRIIEEAMLKLGFKGELSMTLENNVMINRFLEAIGAVPYKTYPIYSRGLEGEKPTA